jgi:membrane protein required for beta-lactamase induction
VHVATWIEAGKPARASGPRRASSNGLAAIRHLFDWLGVTALGV